MSVCGSCLYPVREINVPIRALKNACIEARLLDGQTASGVQPCTEIIATIKLETFGEASKGSKYVSP